MKAHDFSLLDQNEELRNLSDWAGKYLVLYFYPKDDTPGCTTQACSFRDEYEVIQEAGAEVVGISLDPPASHRKFAAKHNLKFPLLSDESGEIIEAYGAWDKKSMFGRTFMGTIRKTFLIDPDGNIVKEYPKVTPKDHAVQILKDLAELKQNSAA